MSGPLRSFTQTVVLGSKPLRSYLLDIIVSFNQGIEVVEIMGKGKNISRAVTLYNMLLDRLGDSLTLDHVEIGSLLERGRRVSYIKIKVRRL
mgnify:CR=1 FL=1